MCIITFIDGPAVHEQIKISKDLHKHGIVNIPHKLNLSKIHDSIAPIKVIRGYSYKRIRDTDYYEFCGEF